MDLVPFGFSRIFSTFSEYFRISRLRHVKYNGSMGK